MSKRQSKPRATPCVLCVLRRLKVDVNPNSPSVFTWTPMAVTSSSANPVAARIASARPGLARPQPAASQAARLSAQSKSV